MLQHSLSIGVVGLGTVGRMLCDHCVRKGCVVHVHDTSDTTLTHTTTTSQTHPHRTLVSLLNENVSAILVALPTLPPLPTNTNTNTNTKCLHVRDETPIHRHQGYDLSSFYHLLQSVATSECAKTTLVFIYSTLAPTTMNGFKREYPQLHMFHVPEFLSSGSVVLDDVCPTRPRVLLGVPERTPASVAERARVFLLQLVSTSQTVVVVKSNESEATKLFCNAFYAAKVQLCNEFYQLCKQHHISYDMVRHLMLENGWIHPMHTNVPGADGQLGFGGRCLPKDLEALCLWSSAEQKQNVDTHTTTKPTLQTSASVRISPPSVLQAVWKAHCERKEE